MTSSESLPSPGPSSPDELAAISLTFVAHARAELDIGNRPQASEKVWGAANYALKAVAAQRGWYHAGQRPVFALAEQLTREENDTFFIDKLLQAQALHYNFYDNSLTELYILAGIDSVEEYVDRLNEVRAAPPKPFTIRNQEDQRRFQRLLGRDLAIGSSSEIGFAQPQ